MRKLPVALGLIVALVALVALVAGGAIARAATSYTAPKDHAQAFITQNQFNQWVARRQVGFTNVSHPSLGTWCFTLPANANPNISVPVVTINSSTSDNSVLAEAEWSSDNAACTNPNDIEIVTGRDNGNGPFTGGLANESFSIVVP